MHFEKLFLWIFYSSEIFNLYAMNKQVAILNMIAVCFPLPKTYRKNFLGKTF